MMSERFRRRFNYGYGDTVGTHLLQIGGDKSSVFPQTPQYHLTPWNSFKTQIQWIESKNFRGETDFVTYLDRFSCEQCKLGEERAEKSREVDDCGRLSIAYWDAFIKGVYGEDHELKAFGGVIHQASFYPIRVFWIGKAKDQQATINEV